MSADRAFAPSMPPMPSGDRPVEHRVRVAVANLHAGLDAHATVTTQVLLGEAVTVLEALDETWWRVRATLDGYEGFVRRVALDGASGPVPTHVVTARTTLRFPGPGIKRVPAVRLPLGARVALVPDGAPTHEGLVACADGGWVHASHLAPLHAAPAHTDPLAAAAQWLDAPYLWGGRTPDGCDCSGLVQGVARACGLALPRDSGDQERAVAETVALEDRRTADLVFWPGHVAIVAPDPTRVLHANAYTLSVAVEPLADVIARAGAPDSVRRLPDLPTGGGTSSASGPSLGDEAPHDEPRLS